MTAFIAASSAHRFFTRQSSLPSSSRPPSCRASPRMTANWPDDPGPAYAKYLSRIPLDRLNKAPVITINYFKNQDYDSVSVRLADKVADEGAGLSLKAGLSIDDEQPPHESKWRDYYDPATVNEAPFISIYTSPLPYDKHAVCIVQTTVPTNVSAAKPFLGDVDPDPSKYTRFQGRLNVAPSIQAVYRTSDDDSVVSVENTYTPLNSVAAEAIFSQYR